MRIRPLLLIASIFLFSSIFNSTTAQRCIYISPVITVQQTICVGECATIYISPTAWAYIWTIEGPGGFLSSGFGGEIPICFDGQYEVGEYTVSADYLDGLDPTPKTFVLTDFFVPEIYSTDITACPDNSVGGQFPDACDKVCAFSTVTYEANDSQGLPLQWEVYGAENYSIDGTSVNVTWGDAGYGQLSVEVLETAIPLEIYCGQFSPVSAAGQDDGQGFVHINGGIPPYDLYLIGPDDNLFVQGSVGLNQFADMGIGTFYAVVTDATGAMEECQFNVGDNNGCDVNLYPGNISPPSSCDSCNASLTLVPIGGSAPYEFGIDGLTLTDNTINNLCPGSHFIYVTDSEGCTTSQSITIGCNSGCSGENVLCVEILEEVKADIETNPPLNNGIVEACEGQTIYFENISENGVNYAWDFGDLNSTSSVNPQHEYSEAGAYQVQLIAINECLCNDTTYITVQVEDAMIPEIKCEGTVCENETIRYETEADCTTFYWNIIGDGSISEGGGLTDNFITVDWDSGPEGIIELAVDGCSDNTCAQVGRTIIPIISGDAFIEGPNEVCRGDLADYFIPEFEGTEIVWEVSESGTINSGQSSHRVSIKWDGPLSNDGTQWVAVQYDNCYLGCGGGDTLPVHILPEFYFAGAVEVCENSNTEFKSINASTSETMESNWTLYDENGVAVWNSATADSVQSVPWSFAPGRYELEAAAAIPSDYCNDKYNAFINIVAGPNPPTDIIGNHFICPGNINTYEAISDEPFNDFKWIITSGDITQEQNGNPVNIVWGDDPPYELAVSQIRTAGMACESDTIMTSVEAIENFEVTGNDIVCREQNSFYSATFFQNTDYQWSILPDNSGTILSGEGTENIAVLWHGAGNASLRLEICGLVEIIDVTVLPSPNPEVIHPESLCAGETTQVQVNSIYNTYQWFDEDGNSISLLDMPTIGAGSYYVEVTNSFGCIGGKTFNIFEKEQPVVSISTPSSFGLCPGNDPIELFALQSVAGYTYQWLQNGLPTGTNNPVLSTNEAGIYAVQVTDQNGCTAISNEISWQDCESFGGTCINGVCFPDGWPGGGPGGGSGGSSCIPDGEIDFEIDIAPACNVHNYINTSINFIPGTFQWNFGDPSSGANNISNLENPSHTFAVPGFYRITLIGQVPSATPGPPCLRGTWKMDLIPAAANFEWERACPGMPTEFFDRSLFVPTTSILSRTWNFGDPLSGANNTSNLTNPEHIFQTPGNFTVTLTINMDNGCSSSISKVVQVATPPTVNFLPPVQTCQNTALSFEASTSLDVVQYFWNFDDAGSGNANTATTEDTWHTYEMPGSYLVTLTGTNVHGCSDITTVPVTIELNELNGSILVSQMSPICEGDSVIMEAPLGGIDWQWSNSFPGNIISVTETGIYTVTVTDDKGCTYSPSSEIVSVTPQPNSTIFAVEYNDFGQPVHLFQDIYSTCEDGEVFLTTEDNPNYLYSWSNGVVGPSISFTQEQDNILEVGTHFYSVTVTDHAGCTKIAGPFQVVVNERPNNPFISGPFIQCENEDNIIYINNPDPTLTYVWNTGEMTDTIRPILAGQYSVTAFNASGCQTKSNIRIIRPAPDFSLVANGCHTRCHPDTLCLPPIPGVNPFTGYQWFQNGEAIPDPEGSEINLIIYESGIYHVELTGAFSCKSVSDPLVVELEDGFGTIQGEVYFDVNGNGIIDAPDTLMSGVGIGVIDENNVEWTLNTDADGAYILSDVPSSLNYNLEIDTASFDSEYSVDSILLAAELFGCGDIEIINWLVYSDCASDETPLEFSACEGETYTYEGTDILAGTSESFNLSNAEGCDSTIIVSIIELLTDSMSMNMEACEGGSIVYNGMNVPAGMQEDFVFVNENGCDSTVTIIVESLPPESSDLALSACENGFVEYEGVQLFPNTETDFTFPNQNGCDSVVTVMVSAIPPDETPLTLSACENGFVEYEGVQLFPNTETDFTFPNQNGCDSVVTVMVSAIPPDETPLTLSACENGFVEYEGVQLFPNSETDFTFLNQNGCDSIVTVTVESLDINFTPLTLEACDGSSIIYNGVPLFPGDEMDFLFVNENGCDSTVNVVVDPLETDFIIIDLQACEGAFAEYNGEQLAIDSQTEFLFQNQEGCDSIVQVNVSAYPEVIFEIESDETCWNSDAGFLEIMNIQGQTAPYQYSLDGIDFQNETSFENLPAGSHTIWLKDVNDCLYEQTVNIAAIPPLEILTENEILPCNENGVWIRPQIIAGNPLALNWQWQDGSIDNRFYATTAGTYQFSVGNECESLDRSIEVEWAMDDRSSFLYVPNVFSPNGDGFNDDYRIFPAPDVQVLSFNMLIFDRWGDLIFETNDIDQGWNGDFLARQMDTGVYVYWLDIQFIACGRNLGIFKKGDILLLK